MKVNCAVEESTIGGRRQELLPQDKFVRDHVKPDDIVIISLGGNDIALRPTCCTALNMMSLLCCSTTSCIQRYGSSYAHSKIYLFCFTIICLGLPNGQVFLR
jgi:hypothetical protein